VILEDTGRYAGLEVVGDLDRLVKNGALLAPGPRVAGSNEMI
jgi:hypothetical protein